MYSFQSRVRYSETDETGTLSLLALVNYLQDCALFQTEHLGAGIEHVQRTGHHWLIAAWEIEVGELPRFGEQIEVSTWARSFERLFAGRNFTVRRAGEAEPLVRVDSLWFMLDDSTGRPMRLPKEETDLYRDDIANDAPLDMPAIQRRIPVEGPGEPGAPIAVTRAHIDTNHHVNNAQYIDMALGVLPEGLRVRRLDVQYVEAARLGDTVCPSVRAVEGGYVVSLDDASGKPYAVVRVRG